MENFKKATNDEVIQIASKLWDTPNMQNYIVKNYDYYFTKDNLILEIEKPNKIKIETTIYFDDETESPEKNEANFVLYNLRLHSPLKMLDDYLIECENLKSMRGASGKYDYNGIYFINIRNDKDFLVDCNYRKEKSYFIRYLTKEEQTEYIKLLKDYKEIYINRLKTYNKKYNKKIHVVGFWANR